MKNKFAITAKNIEKFTILRGIMVNVIVDHLYQGKIWIAAEGFNKVFYQFKPDGKGNFSAYKVKN